MKALYFCDCAGDVEEEKREIQRELHRYGIELEMETTTLPPWRESYDILFFDWGGMSLGNSMLEHFCEHWIEEAREKPSRVYIMTSSFTESAMKDARGYQEREIEEFPKNIFLNIDAAAPYLKSLLKIKE